MRKKLLYLTLLASTFANAQWTEQNTAFATPFRGIEEIKIVNATTVWARAYDGSGGGANVQEFTRTTDGGTTWTTGTINVGNTALDIVNISPVSATTAWAAAIDEATGLGVIYKTTDSGVTWTRQNNAAFQTNGSSWLNGVHFFNSLEGVAFGDPAPASRFEISRTVDGGTTWSSPAPGNNPTASANEYGYGNSMASSGNTLWFTTSLGRLYKTTDKGATWTKHQTPIVDFGGYITATSSGNVYFSSTTNGIILASADSGATYSLYKTTDGGVTWSAGTAFTAPYRNLSYVPNTNILVGTGTVASVNYSGYSLDNGTTWTQLDTGVQRTSISFLNDTTGWAGGFNTNATTGGIFKYTGPGFLSNKEFNSTSEFSVYPNPTNGVIKVASANAINKIAIYDMLGKEVFNKNFSNTSNEVSVDLSEIKTGIYFLKATSSNERVQTIKIAKN